MAIIFNLSTNVIGLSCIRSRGSILV